MDKKKILWKVLAGSKNVRFEEIKILAEAFGFRLKRVRGSHHVFTHPGTPDLLNLQDCGGQAKPYQIRQFLSLVEEYHLSMEDADNA
jgi:hypothetical protein